MLHDMTRKETEPAAYAICRATYRRSGN